MNTTRAAALTGRKLELCDLQLPDTLASDDVLLNISVSTLCGSDIEYYASALRGEVEYQRQILGHEAKACVLAVGRNVRHLKPRDIVWVNPLKPDKGHPLYSALQMRDMLNMLPNPQFLATPPVAGTLRSQMTYPAELCEKIDLGDANPEVVALIEPLACSFQGVNHLDTDQIGLVGSEWGCAVVGDGPIGVLTCAALLSKGCSRVVLIGCTEARLAKAKGILNTAFGNGGRVATVHAKRDDPMSVVEPVKRLALHDWGIEAMIDCSGDPRVLSPAMEYTSLNAQLVVIGRMLKGIAYNRPAWQRGEKSVKACYRFNRRAIDDAKRLLLGPHRVDLTDIITHRFPLSKAAEALDLAHRKPPEVVKILVNCQA